MNGNKQPGPPDLDKLLIEWIKKVKAFFQHTPSNASSPSSAWNTKPPSLRLPYKSSLGVVGVAIVFLWFLSGIFIVNPAEEAVILRFGQFTEVLSPGLHWMARFIEAKYLIDVQKIYSFSLQGDFLTKSSEQGDLQNQIIQLDPARKTPESLDQSKNLVNVELNVQYRISDPRAYLFNMVDPDNTIQEVASGALSDVIGTMKLDDVLTTGREMLSSGVLDRVKATLLSYQCGLSVVSVTLKKVQAPDQVREAFNDVNRADQDKATYIQQAQAYASKVVPFAQGVAARTIADANGYQQQIVLSAEGQIARYQALTSAYKSAPEVTRARLYLETVEGVLEKTSKILIDSNASNNILYLPIDKLMKPLESEHPVAATVTAGVNNETN